MIQQWEIWLVGDKKTHILKNIEQLLGQKVIETNSSSSRTESSVIHVVRFYLPLLHTDFTEAFVEALSYAEKIHPSWTVTGVTEKQISAECTAAFFSVSDIHFATWSLSDAKEEK